MEHAESLVLRAVRWHAQRRQTADNQRIGLLPGANRIYLSEATGCPRKASLRLLKYPASQRSQFSQQAMASGLRGEEKILLLLEAAGFDVQRQYPVQTKWGNGKIDAFCNPIESASTEGLYLDRPLVVEIKTSKIDHVNRLPWEDHKDQCLLYMGLIAGYHDYLISSTDRDFNGQIPYGEVTYVLKKEHTDDVSEEKITSYPVEWNAARFQYLINKLDLIDTWVRQRKPVPMELAGKRDKDRIPCQYPNAGKCAYWNVCYGGENSDTMAAEQAVMEF